MRQPRILVAEDHYLYRYVLERHLRSWGMEVVSAGDAFESLKYLSEQNFDLFICDNIMPRLMGCGLIHVLRSGFAEVLSSSSPREIPAIALTASSRAEEVSELMLAGFDDYCRKPFDPDELQARIRVLLRISMLKNAIQRLSLREAFGTLVVNKLREAFNVASVEVPGVGEPCEKDAGLPTRLSIARDTVSKRLFIHTIENVPVSYERAKGKLREISTDPKICHTSVAQVDTSRQRLEIVAVGEIDMGRLERCIVELDVGLLPSSIDSSVFGL